MQEKDKELAPQYNPKLVESKWISIWEKDSIFKAEKTFLEQENSPSQKKQGSYSIVIPPPNVTGSLHVGHALNQSIQDLLIRDARKRGKKTLWLPGTDHAGIATQVKVEESLRKKSMSREELGREKFVDAVWEWKKKHGSLITEQQKLMGFSVDWSRECFTMDENLSLAVRKAFVQLYEQGLIYKAKRIVNWDPQTRTVLSQLEVEYDDNYTGFFYSVAYPLLQNSQQNSSDKNDNKKELVVATTRPETILGDVALAVHPDDKRYQSFIGSKVKHPLLPKEIPIIADSILVDPKFGTGVVKVTPAHDINDFETGQRHNLESINIFDKNACINENGGPYQGYDRYKAREIILRDLQNLNLFRGKQKKKISVGRSQRSNAIIEPMLSTQWFLKIETLSKKAIAAVEEGELVFYPKKWENTYFHWMHNIHDWCISRQLWWGHQIPAWYGPDKKIFVALSEEAARKQALAHYKKEVILRQDEDVLDTWFSSSLWPFSTLNWDWNDTKNDTKQDTPSSSLQTQKIKFRNNLEQRKDDFKNFFPTEVVVTGFDIIFFWIVRMIMMSLHFTKQVPFRKVYIHNLMRDEKGEKMSKTKGNVVEPLSVCAIYGTDAFRFFLLSTLSEAKDSIYSEQRLKGYQNFTNKIWNATRFVLQHAQKQNFTSFADLSLLGEKGLKSEEYEAEDFWILSRLELAVAGMRRAIDSYKFQHYAEIIYSFIWHEFCDWYLELIKPRLFSENTERATKGAFSTVFFVTRTFLHYLHPAMPFITEELSSCLNKYEENESREHSSLTLSLYPSLPKLSEKQKKLAQEIQSLQDLSFEIRTIRAELSLSPSSKIEVFFFSTSQNLLTFLQTKKTVLMRLVNAESFNLKEYLEKKDEIKKIELKKIPYIEKIIRDGEVLVRASQSEMRIVRKKEELRIQKEKKDLFLLIKKLETKMSNTEFINKAPKDLVERENTRLEKAKAKLEKLEK